MAQAEATGVNAIAPQHRSGRNRLATRAVTPHFDGVQLHDVTVGEYEQGGDTGVPPLLEHVALDFAKV